MVGAVRSRGSRQKPKECAKVIIWEEMRVMNTKEFEGSLR
jgi:hypothetical protein